MDDNIERFLSYKGSDVLDGVLVRNGMVLYPAFYIKKNVVFKVDFRKMSLRLCPNLRIKVLVLVDASPEFFI